MEVAARGKGAIRRTELVGQVQSVSPNGMGFQVAEPGTPGISAALEQDRRIHVRFELDSKPIELPGHVVYVRGSDDAPYVGLRVELEVAAAAARQRYVAWVVDLLRTVAV